MSCQSCNDCNRCQSGCQDCDNCNVECDSSQSFCNTGSQLAKSYVNFPDWGEKNNDQNNDTSLFLTARQWNNFITFIYQAYCQGEKNNAWGNPEYTAEFEEFVTYGDNDMDIRAGQIQGKRQGTQDFMYADMYNGALKKMHYLANRNTNTTNIINDVSSGDIIYAETFNILRDYALTKFKLNKSQCDSCNNSCQGCDDCNDCDNAQCNTPQECCDDTPPEDGGEE